MLDLLIAVVFQVIQVNQTTPCFLNDTAGADIWRNCGFGTDYIAGALIGFEWITGGYFSMILVGLLVGITYIKYQKVIYPLIIGMVFLPISYFLFPDTWLNYAFLFGIFGLGALLYYIIVRKTKEYEG